MIQRIITLILPLSLTFLIYILYIYIQKVRHKNVGSPFIQTIQHMIRAKHFVPLFLAGVILMIATLIYTTFGRSYDPNKQYAPPRYENGTLIPAQETSKDQKKNE